MVVNRSSASENIWNQEYCATDAYADQASELITVGEIEKPINYRGSYDEVEGCPRLPGGWSHCPS